MRRNARTVAIDRRIPAEPPRIRPLPLAKEAHLDRRARVYVNRNMRLASIGAIGFDLDHTLAHYDPEPVERLAFRLTQQKLVEKKHYPQQILSIEYDPEFVIRGLVVDRRRGNLLKMDYHNYVSRACHGRRLLSPEERKRVYRRRRVRLSHEAYVSVDTLFHLPEVYLYVALIDYFDSEKRAFDTWELYADIREAIDEAHADGSIKNRIMAEPSAFIREDPQIAATMDEFRRSGKRLFLLTNSEMYYTDALLTYIFRNDLNGRASWKEFFDLIVVEARKPGFFLSRGGRDMVPRALAAEGTLPPVFAGGDAAALEKRIGFRGDQILYFGDHTYGDILRSKKSLGWRTAMILSELDHEIATTERIKDGLKSLHGVSARRDELVVRKVALARAIRRLTERATSDGGRGHANADVAALEDEMVRSDAEILRLEREAVSLDARLSAEYNRHWGPLFRERSETSRFGHQVKDFACLYTGRVSNFMNYPWDHYFQSPGSFMPHEL
jgi:HAD superfamily 5'-nucleotidase-like hydrolase